MPILREALCPGLGICPACSQVRCESSQRWCSPGAAIHPREDLTLSILWFSVGVRVSTPETRGRVPAQRLTSASAGSSRWPIRICFGSSLLPLPSPSLPLPSSVPVLAPTCLRECSWNSDAVPAASGALRGPRPRPWLPAGSVRRRTGLPGGTGRLGGIASCMLLMYYVVRCCTAGAARPHRRCLFIRWCMFLFARRRDCRAALLLRRSSHRGPAGRVP